MLRGVADYKNSAKSLYDFALLAHWFYACTYFHKLNPCNNYNSGNNYAVFIPAALAILSEAAINKIIWNLSEAPGDSTLGQIIRCHFKKNLVPGQNLDAVESHFTGQVTGNSLPWVQFDAKNSIRQAFYYLAL